MKNKEKIPNNNDPIVLNYKSKLHSIGLQILEELEAVTDDYYRDAFRVEVIVWAVKILGAFAVSMNDEKYIEKFVENITEALRIRISDHLKNEIKIDKDKLH